MKLGIKKIKDKLNRTVLLRNAEPGDAGALIEYLKATSAETPYLIREPEEVTLTQVVSGNTNAIILYEKLGFVKYGTFPDNMKYADGSYASAEWMLKKL